MKAPEQYYKEVIDNAIALWNENGFKGMEHDPLVNLLLQALAYQSYQIQKNIEHYEEHTLRNLRDRIIPHYLTQPVPAFSIVHMEPPKDATEEIMVDENYTFEFKKNNKEKYNFTPLLRTKIIDAKLLCENHDAHTIVCTLKSEQEIDLSGISLYFDTEEPVEILKIIECNQNREIPIIKPNQYNELPFTAWFNNNHWFLSETFHLFGTYEYWQEVFLTNTTNLYYIDTCKPLENSQPVTLEITVKEPINIEDLQLKINCVPVVQIDKNEITLDENSPIKELAEKQNKDKEFLHLLCNSNENDIEDYTNKFMIRQFGVERYNPKILLEQLQEIEKRYVSDYYAFQNIGVHDFSIDKKDNAVKTLHDVIKEMIKKISLTLNNSDTSLWNHSNKNNNYYAVLRTETRKNVHIDYVTTSGESANGIKKYEKAKTFDATLLIETQGGRNAITDETRKEDIAKYYFQTKDRLVTIADIRAFCYKELGSKHIKKIDIEKDNNSLTIKITPKGNHKIDDKKRKIIERKLSLHTNAYNIQLEIMS